MQELVTTHELLAHAGGTFGVEHARGDEQAVLVVDDAELGPLRRSKPFVGLLLPEVPEHGCVSPARVLEAPVDHDLPGAHHGLRRRPWIVLRLDRNRWPDILRLQYRGTARTPRGDGERRGEGDQARWLLD